MGALIMKSCEHTEKVFDPWNRTRDHEPTALTVRHYRVLVFYLEPTIYVI